MNIIFRMTVVSPIGDHGRIERIFLETDSVCETLVILRRIATPDGNGFPKTVGTESSSREPDSSVGKDKSLRNFPKAFFLGIFIHAIRELLRVRQDRNTFQEIRIVVMMPTRRSPGGLQLAPERPRSIDRIPSFTESDPKDFPIDSAFFS
jgi:hypothetical protein